MTGNKFQIALSFITLMLVIVTLALCFINTTSKPTTVPEPEVEVVTEIVTETVIEYRMPEYTKIFKDNLTTEQSNSIQKIDHYHHDDDLFVGYADPNHRDRRCLVIFCFGDTYK